MGNGVLDEAYERLRATGPERDGFLSNHAPMAVEVLAHRGYEHRVHLWLDSYADRMEERPRGIQRIPADEWRDPLGDPTRSGDWLDYFDRALADEPWRDVLARWWPRLLPGIAAGATHGVIRVGHAVRALLDSESAPRVMELGHGLAYWAARWQPLAPAGAGWYRAGDPRAALDAVPRVPDQRFGIRSRLAQLAQLPTWAGVAAAVPGTDAQEVPVRLAAIVDAAVARYATHGYGSPIMLVHAATAPNAVARALPALPGELWRPSLAAAWAATAAVTAAYSPAQARPDPASEAGLEPDEILVRAIAVGDPHAIKFVDTAIDGPTAGRSGGSLTAAAEAVRLIGDG
jgi:hypothetical protein